MAKKKDRVLVGFQTMPKDAKQWARGFVNHSSVKASVVAKQAGGILAKALKLRYIDHLSVEDIARVVGVPDRTLRDWMAPFAVLMDNPEEIKEFKKYEADIMDGVRFLMTQGMVEKLSDPVMRKKMDLSRLTYGFGILFDKARLERGESTTNVMTLSELVRAAHAKPVLEEAKVIEHGDKVVEAAIEAVLPEKVEATAASDAVVEAEGEYGW